MTVDHPIISSSVFEAFAGSVAIAEFERLAVGHSREAARPSDVSAGPHFFWCSAAGAVFSTKTVMSLVLNIVGNVDFNHQNVENPRKI